MCEAVKFFINIISFGIVFVCSLALIFKFVYIRDVGDFTFFLFSVLEYLTIIIVTVSLSITFTKSFDSFYKVLDALKTSIKERKVKKSLN